MWRTFNNHAHVHARAFFAPSASHREAVKTDAIAALVFVASKRKQSFILLTSRESKNVWKNDVVGEVFFPEV